MNGKFRIVAAVCLGLLLVGGSFYMSQERALSTDIALDAVIAPAPDREYITVEDADGDGTADWMDTLPPAPFAVATTTGTTTHTEKLAIYTLEQLIRSGIEGGTADSEAILEDSSGYLASLASEEPFTLDDVASGEGESADELRAYGNRIAEITFENSASAPAESETTILGRALQENDPSKLADLTRIVTGYDGMIADMQAMLVPPSYAYEHLDLLNAYNAVRADIAAMEQAFSDPILALARFGRYEDDTNALYQAISNLYLKLHEDGIQWTDEDAASDFIRIEYRS